MAEDRIERRLAAILAADVVGYSRLMGVDESGALNTLNRHRRETIDPAIARHGGRIVKTAGDSVLAEFASAVAAVQCAADIQRDMTCSNTDLAPDLRMEFRIGVNLGEVIVQDRDIFGDGVNVATRLEGLAEPGRVCISAVVYDQVKGKVPFAFDDLGAKEVKNIADPIHIYRIVSEVPANYAAQAPVASSFQRPVVAVLPFQNMSGESNREYFADGLTEDIITALSKHRWLRVVARNTTFGYKGRSPDIRQLARELDANYVVEGSVRHSGQRLRINAQLIDGATGDHVWAEHYDRNLEDIFELQDEITAVIVARVEPELGFAERNRVEHMPRRNLQAWDCYHLGMSHFFKFTAEDNLEAQRLFKRSSEIDPDFGAAYAWWAYAVVLGMVYWDTEPNESLLDEALAATKRALSIDDQNAVFYMMMGRISLARREYASSLSGNQAAIRLNPTFAAAYCAMGDALAYEGRYEESIGQFEKAFALSPNDPQRWAFLTYGSLALIFKHDFDKALEWTERADVIPNRQYWTIAHMAVSLAYLDRQADARQAVARLLAEKPDFSIAFAKRKLFYIKRPEQLVLYMDGLRKAGVPEK